jgi:hypothetical protein
MEKLTLQELILTDNLNTNDCKLVNDCVYFAPPSQACKCKFENNILFVRHLHSLYWIVADWHPSHDKYINRCKRMIKYKNYKKLI